MITSLLNKVAGLLEKDLLFGSVLPALLFLGGATTTVVVSIGGSAVGGWWDQLTATENLALTLLSSLLILVFAYVLQALRVTLVELWAGRTSFILLQGPQAVGEWCQRWHYRVLKRRADQAAVWPDVASSFRKQALEALEKAGKTVPDRRKRPDLLAGMSLRLRPWRLHPALGVRRVHRLLGPLVEGFSEHPEAWILPVFQRAQRTLGRWAEKDEGAFRQANFELDRAFGSEDSIRATRLGNIIESYERYAAKRYRIEAGIFWPRLQAVMPDDFLKQVREPKILLDFSLATSTLSSLYATLCLICGPWLAWQPRLWLVLGGLGLLTSLLFYKVALSAADHFGQMVRAGFDLYRLELMGELQRPAPKDFRQELEQWEELSKVAVYGEREYGPGFNFDFVQPPSSQIVEPPPHQRG